LIVQFTPSARSQFLEGVGHIARDDPDAAKGFRRKAESKLRRLARFPKSGRPIPEFPDLPHREIVVPPYRFFYRVQGQVVWVVAVWNGARLPRQPAA